MINFVKNMLTKKKTDDETFNNKFLNLEIPKIISNINLNHERKFEVNRDELEVVFMVKNIMDEYFSKFAEI